MKETQAEDMRAQARSWLICSSEMPLQAFGHVFPLCFSLKGQCSIKSTHTHAHTQTHWLAFATHLHACKTRPGLRVKSWESCVLSLQQTVAMPHCLPRWGPRRWPRSTIKPQRIRTGLAQGWRLVNHNTLQTWFYGAVGCIIEATQNRVDA